MIKGKREKMTDRKTKQGQMEIMGIAVIMVLFSIALLVYLGMSMRPSDALKPKIDMKEYQTNFITVLLRTTTTCSRATVENLLKDVVSYDMPIECEGLYNPSGSKMVSADFLNDATQSPVRIALQDAFQARYPNRDYYLVFCKQDAGSSIFRCDCGGSRWNSTSKECEVALGHTRDSTATPVYFRSDVTHYCVTNSLMIQPIPTDRGTMSLAFWICDSPK
jgi:hypothetical protein